MTIKQQVINEFLTHDKKNFTIFGTNYDELSKMYDSLVSWLKLGKTYQNFLVTEGAVSLNGSIREDRSAVVNNERYKKDVTVSFPFKYPVYAFMFSKLESIKKQMQDKPVT